MIFEGLEVKYYLQKVLRRQRPEPCVSLRSQELLCINLILGPQAPGQQLEVAPVRASPYGIICVMKIIFEV